jgi:hypothetical protein
MTSRKSYSQAGIDISEPEMEQEPSPSQSSSSSSHSTIRDVRQNLSNECAPPPINPMHAFLRMIQILPGDMHHLVKSDDGTQV